LQYSLCAMASTMATTPKFCSSRDFANNTHLHDFKCQRIFIGRRLISTKVLTSYDGFPNFVHLFLSGNLSC
jgi:hypothetical protein